MPKRRRRSRICCRSWMPTALTSVRRPAELLKLGLACVLAVLRWDLTQLSQEQKARCQALIKSFRQGNSEVAVEGRGGRTRNSFWRPCRTTTSRCARPPKPNLKSFWGHAVNYDVAATPEARSTAMDTMRKDLEKEIAAKLPPKPAEPDNAVGPNNTPAGLLQNGGPKAVHN